MLEKEKKSCLLGLHLFLSRAGGTRHGCGSTLPDCHLAGLRCSDLYLAQLPRGNHIYREKRETEKAQTERPTTSEADRANS